MAEFVITPNGDAVLALTKSEAQGLRAIAHAGGEGLFNDAAAGRAYIGTATQIEAARRALDALCKAAAQAKARK